TELRAIVLHHRAEDLLAGGEAEPEERGLGIGEDLEQRQRHLDGGDRCGGRGFPGGRSCATSLHGGFLSLGCGDPVLYRTATRAAASSSAGQFNRVRDIPLGCCRHGRHLFTDRTRTVAGPRSTSTRTQS